MSPQLGPAFAVLCAYAAMAGCGKGEAEVKGWSSPRPLRPDVDASVTAAPKPLPPRPKLVDIAAALAPPETPDVVQAPDEGPEDTADGDVIVVRTWKGMSTCDRLIETACAYLGTHSQECAEARGRRQPRPTDETLTECQAIIDQFEMTYNRPGIRRIRSACWSLAYDICRDYGRASEACVTAREEARRLITPRLKRACRGGVILYEAKRAFPDWLHGVGPGPAEAPPTNPGPPPGKKKAKRRSR